MDRSSILLLLSVLITLHSRHVLYWEHKVCLVRPAICHNIRIAVDRLQYDQRLYWIIVVIIITFVVISFVIISCVRISIENNRFTIVAIGCTIDK